MTSNQDMAMSLLDAHGRRKYLCANEHRRFLTVAARADFETRTFCELLAFTGCRISEGLSLTAERLDAETGCVIFRTLKRRKRVYRAVPVSPALMTALRQLSTRQPLEAPLWGWCRQTAWRRVKAVMAAADIVGTQAMPRGLRHGFGVANAEQNIPASLTRRWMGHARLETTAMYQHAVGREERAFAKRLWTRSEIAPTKD